jgi:hypothetical protein
MTATDELKSSKEDTAWIRFPPNEMMVNLPRVKPLAILTLLVNIRAPSPALETIVKKEQAELFVNLALSPSLVRLSVLESAVSKAF